MHWLRRSSILGLALLLAVGLSCSSPTGPTEFPVEQHSSQMLGGIGDLAGDLTGTVVGTLGKVTNLLTCSPQPYAVISKTIGRKGGEIRVGTHRLEIPKNALKRKTRITAEQIPGSTNSIRFSPEGLRFERPAELTMSYENCVVVLIQKKIAYTDENLKILEVLRSLDLFKKKMVSAPIDHFSRYAVTW